MNAPTMRSTIIALAAFAAGTSQAGAACPSRAWVNAFHPEQAVFPKPTDNCPADLKKPAFTREGALACSSPEMLSAASNAMNRGWRYVPTAGVQISGFAPGATVSPESFGCRAYHDAVPVKALHISFATAETDLGWLSVTHIRNAPSVQPAGKDNRLRPQLCDKNGCVYTDVRPYEPVK
jgi:hypothetical protein